MMFSAPNNKRTWFFLILAALMAFALGLAAIWLSRGIWNVPLPSTMPTDLRSAEGMAEARRLGLAVEKQNVRNLLAMIGTTVPLVFCIAFGLALRRFSHGIIWGLASAAVGFGLAWFAGPEIHGLGYRLVFNSVEGVTIALTIHALFWLVVGVAVGVGCCAVHGFQIHYFARGVIGAVIGSFLFVLITSVINGDSFIEHIRQEERQNQLLWLAAPMIAMATVLGFAPKPRESAPSQPEKTP